MHILYCYNAAYIGTEQISWRLVGYFAEYEYEYLFVELQVYRRIRQGPLLLTPDSMQYTSLTIKLKIYKIQWKILLHSLPELCVQFSSFDFSESHFHLLNRFSRYLSSVVLVQLIAFSIYFPPFIFNHYSALFSFFAFTYINIIWYLATHQLNMKCNSICWDLKITLWLGLEKKRIVVRFLAGGGGGRGKIYSLQNIQTASQEHIKLFNPFEVRHYLWL